MILTAEDYKSIRAVGANVPNDRIEVYIEQAETLVVMQALGVDLYKSISENKSQYTLLLDGGYYTTQDGQSWTAGLKKAIAYIAHSKFILNNSVSVTAFGVRTKESTYSDKAAENEVIRQSNEARNVGDEYLYSCIKYCKETGLIADDSCSCSKSIKKGRKFFAI